MYILQSFPTDTIQPLAFPAGSRAKLEKTLRTVRKEFTDSGEVFESWDAWANRVAPLTDDVYEFIKDHGGMAKFHRPLPQNMVLE
jgi:hypothetical protein